MSLKLNGMVKVSPVAGRRSEVPETVLASLAKTLKLRSGANFSPVSNLAIPYGPAIQRMGEPAPDSASMIVGSPMVLLIAAGRKENRPSESIFAILVFGKLPSDVLRGVNTIQSDRLSSAPTIALVGM